MKVLNLYAGIGGNRKLWENVEVTAIENDPIIAEVYKYFYPNDKVIVTDAKDYLLKHFKEYDFIWASPPCPTHSRMRLLWKGDPSKIKTKFTGYSYRLPDMDLYSIIIFLKHFYEGDYVVENVISYYEPLIKPQVIDNHYFWSNKLLSPIKKQSRDILGQDLESKSKLLGISIPNIDKPLRFKRKLLNNCVRPEVGLHILNCITKKSQNILI